METVLNSELKLATEWLKANRLSLNVKKSKLLLFRSKQSKINNDNISIKLDGTKLALEANVKYLGMTIDNNLSWDDHINNLKKKLSRANGILAKLRSYVPKKTLSSVYYAIFHSQLLYGCLMWSLTTAKNFDSIKVLQKKCLRIMNFSPYNSHTNELFILDKILKIEDVIKFEQIKLAFEFKKSTIPNDIMNLFQENINDYNTRNMKKGGLIIPKITSVSYGDRSLRYIIPKVWNEYIKYNDYQNLKSALHLKSLFKKKVIETYISI